MKRFAHARTAVGARELSDTDLFGDSSVVALHLPGHTPGSLALLVRLPSGAVVLSGDTVHTREALEAEVAYPGDVDSLSARRSVRRLTALLQAERADLWIAHDPQDWQRYRGPERKALRGPGGSMRAH